MSRPCLRTKAIAKNRRFSKKKKHPNWVGAAEFRVFRRFFITFPAMYTAAALVFVACIRTSSDVSQHARQNINSSAVELLSEHTTNDPKPVPVPNVNDFALLWTCCRRFCIVHRRLFFLSPIVAQDQKNENRRKMHQTKSPSFSGEAPKNIP